MPVLVLALALLLALPPAVAAGQSCHPQPGIWTGVEVGRVGYDVAGGIEGTEWGTGAGVEARAWMAHIGYRRVQLDDVAVIPHLVRGSLRYALRLGAGWSLCPAAHVGGSRFSSVAGEGTVFAGGAGLAVAHRVVLDQVLVVPFVEARGLAARTSGTLLELDTTESGLSVGVEGGATAHVRRVRIRATASRDGFAPGLGTTPYPTWSIRLGVDYRF